MTAEAFSRKLSAGMRWVIGEVIILLVAAKTGVGCAVVIAVVALHTVICNELMSPFEQVIVVVNAKGGRTPARLC